MDRLYVQDGRGLAPSESWLNFGVTLTLPFRKVSLIGSLLTRSGPRLPPGARHGDITKGIPIADDSHAGIYCSHALEHLGIECNRGGSE